MPWHARELVTKDRVPVLVEVIIERETNIAMGTAIDAITQFEELTREGKDAPTAIALLD